MKALLVVDMLNDFILEDGRLTNGKAGKEIIGFVAEKIKEYREEGYKIIFICDNHEKDDKEFKMFPQHCVAGSYGSEIIEQLDLRDEDKIIYKRRYSAFFATELDLYLRENNIREIGLVGVCTNICILYTTADARNLDYDVVVYEKGVASFDQEAHKFALKEIGTSLGGKVL